MTGKSEATTSDTATADNSSSFSLRFADLQPHDRYKILCGVVVPRPIAWITTVSPEGVVNAAPFSFFNVFSEDPALVVVGLQHHSDGRLKDTTRNIHRNEQFVINLCDESLAEAMNETAIDFPSDASEVARVGLDLAASQDVLPPRLAQAPFSFECRRHASMVFGPGREILVGEALRVHARHGLLDPDNMHVNFENYQPVGRLFGELYARQSDIFAMPRESLDAFERRKSKDSPPTV